MIQQSTCCFPGSDAWSREARRLCSLAAELGVVLDEVLLTLGDVRDLQAYRDGLERRRTRSITAHAVQAVRDAAAPPCSHRTTLTPP